MTRCTICTHPIDVGVITRDHAISIDDRTGQQVLEQRLMQHEENALKKYADLDAKLASDPRLKILST